MQELRSIEIDFEVHKLIEVERTSFSETPNQVLRRLLKIDVSPGSAKSQTLEDKREWSGKGVSLPHGTELRMEYNGTRHTGVVDDGEWVVEGKRFSSPSAAASAVALTKAGKRTNLDGWNYWYARRPADSDWTAIMQLRRYEPRRQTR